MNNTGRGCVALAFVLVAGTAGAAAAGPKDRPPKGDSGSTPSSTAQVTAPYDAATVTYPARFGLTADKGTGGIRAVDWPLLTEAGPGVRESVAYVGSASPIGEWRTATVTMHVNDASTSTTLQPFFSAYLVLATGGMNTPYDGEHAGWFCASSPLFRSTDSAGGAGINARVEDRAVQLTCTSEVARSDAVWGGVYLRANAETPIDLDATVTSITFSR